jgi:hypothetical protein
MDLLRFKYLLCVTLLITAGTCPSAPAQSMPAQPSLGINLSGPADWNTELPFVDVFRLSRAWISQREGAGWGKGPELDLDESGWIRRLEADCFAETPLCTIEGGHYPSGLWTVLWTGDGRLELSKGKVIISKPGRMTVNINAQGGGFFLRIKDTDPGNPIRSIQVLMPGVTPDEAARNPWNPTFLKRWSGMSCLRFMDFQETNNSEQQHWNERPLLSDATWTRRGIPVEMLCDLANRLHADAWFCIPHQATDEYIREFARLVGKQLQPDRRAWIEYSNEVWNSQFAQHRYAAEQGQKLRLAEKPWEAAWRYTAVRSKQIFAIWQENFGRERLIRVLPSQAANSYVSEQILGWENVGREADVLSIAPYISMNIRSDGEHPTAADITGWSAEMFLDHVEQHALPQTVDWIRRNKAVADQYGLKLTCYEAGQHFVGVGDAVNDERLTKLLHEVNRHPRMAKIYDQYFSAWEAAGGDLLCHFSSVGQWSKWGSWGLLEYADQDPASSPKFVATMRWGRKLGQTTEAP